MNSTRWNERELSHFSYKMSELLQAGLSLVDSLAIVANHFSGSRREQILAIRHQITEGTSFIDAFNRYPFPYPFLVMIGVSQYHGRIADTFSTLGDWFERRHTFKKTVIQKSSYPILLFCFSVSLFIYFFIVLLPQFQFLLNQFEQLPLSTRWLIQIRQHFQANHMLILTTLIGFIGIMTTIVFILKKKQKWYQIRLQIPFIGYMTKLHITYIFTSQLSLLLQAGLGIVEALHQIQNHLHNERLTTYIKEIEHHISMGFPLSKVELAHPIFHEDFYQFTAIGEQTGRLSDQLRLCSKIMEERMLTAIQRFLRLLEPMMILFIGFIILFIVISVFVPILQMIQVI